jgi:YVTN family beta-propeller protein
MPRRFAAVAAFLLAAHPAPAGSSNSLMDVRPDGSQLAVANSDNGSVTFVDLKTRKVLRETPVGAKPEGVAWAGGGDLLLVTLYGGSRVAFVDARTGKVTTLETAAEPYGVVVTRDGGKAYVTHEYPAKISEIDVKGRKVLREIPAGRMIRGVALSPDEKRLYVTEFYSGALHAVNLEQGKVVDSWKGHSTDNIARHVVVHPRRPKAYVSHTRSRIEVIDGNGSIIPHLSICDLVPPTKADRRVSFAMDTYNGVYVVTNPWESALSPDGKRLYTVYAGTDDMNVSTVIDDDYREIRPLGRPRQVGRNPRAVRVSPDGTEVYVANTLDFTVTVHDALVGRRPLATIKVCAPPKSPEWVLGKVLFSSAKYPLSSRRWVACASCHPDGHSDNRVWHNPEGLRKTPALMGLAHTHPLHWSADRDEVQDFEYTIRGRLMRGAGLFNGPIKTKEGVEPAELHEKLAGRSKKLDALAVYTNSFDFPLSPHVKAPGQLSEAATRGKGVFFDKTVGCATCHSGPYYSDSTLKKPFKLHDVGTGKDDPGEKMGPKYDTPTLLGVYRTAPYLHHGKAKTLLDVLTTCNKDDRHGKTRHLAAGQLKDLVAFLESLPYETPPPVTPNTVKHRYVPPQQGKGRDEP